MRKKELSEDPQKIYGAKEYLLSEALGPDYDKYRARWAEVSRRSLVTDFPLYIQIEHTGKCNLSCPSCPQGVEDLRHDYSRGFRPLEIALYRSVLKEAQKYHCPSVSFHNNDEPLLLRDLSERIRMAKQAGFLDIILTTNATLLTKEKADSLLVDGITKINFSIDAWREDVYKAVRVGGDFKTVVKNIDYFYEKRNMLNLKLPIIRVTSVLTKYTVDEQEGFRDFWLQRADMVEFQNFQAISGHTEDLKPPQSEIDSNFSCNAPWQQVVIRANGDVLPCCSFYGDKMVIGNIRESSLYDVWNGGYMRKIREELQKDNYDYFPSCSKCSKSSYVVNVPG